MKAPTGIRRLDELLGGGLPERSAVLIHGPPFVGKEALWKVFVLHGLRQGIPAIIVLTDASATDVHNQLEAMDPSYPKALKAGLVRFVDAYSKTIGAVDKHPHAEFVEGVVNFNAVNLAVNSAQRRIIGDHPTHHLVFDSASTLIAYTNAQTAFRFLQVLIGRTKAAGATSMILLGRGMHADAEVETIKHLMDGVIEFKSEGGKLLIHVQGAGLTNQRGWVEYRFDEGHLEITGSFAAGRIR